MLDNSLATLPFPVVFVCRNTERWSELFLSEASVPDPDTIHNRIINNEDCWIINTYLRLKQHNLNVSLSDRFIPGAICVASTLDFGIKDFTVSSFIVGCRGDGPESALSDFNIVQNQICLKSEKEVFIPIWSQPALVPRNQERDNRIENIVFKGSENNLYEEFRSPQFCQELENIGVQLLISGKSSNSVNWHDYSNADLVLAVRDLTEKDALVKPASKLVNAWMAGVPALLGPEPAFREQKQSPLDYIEIKTPQEALDAIRKLKQNPELYQQMVRNGLQRAEDFTPERITQRWHDVLSGPVAKNYAQWCQRPGIIRRAEFVIRALQERQNKAAAKYHRFHGKRIISGMVT